MAQLGPGLKILVLGCGNGDTAIRLALKFPYSIIATDINPLAITTASKKWNGIKKNAEGNIEFRVDDLFHSQLPLRSFDRVILESVLIMLPKIHALQILHDLLKPEGKLAVNEGVCIDAFFPALKQLELIFQQHQIDWKLPTMGEWIALFEQSQFQIIERFGPNPFSLKRIGLASFFHSPWQSLKIVWKIMGNSEVKQFFRQISTQLRAAAIKWGYGLWLLQASDFVGACKIGNNDS